MKDHSIPMRKQIAMGKSVNPGGSYCGGGKVSKGSYSKGGSVKSGKKC